MQFRHRQTDRRTLTYRSISARCRPIGPITSRANNWNKCISDGLMHVAAWHRWTPESKFTKFGEEMSIGQPPTTMQIFVAIGSRHRSNAEVLNE